MEYFLILVQCLMLNHVATQVEEQLSGRNVTTNLLHQSLFSSCTSSEDCGDHQFCDLQGRKECRCQPGHFVNNMKCIKAVGEGEDCRDDISCMLSDRSLRCSTTQGLINTVCHCREDTRSDIMITCNSNCTDL